MVDVHATAANGFTPASMRKPSRRAGGYFLLTAPALCAYSLSSVPKPESAIIGLDSSLTAAKHAGVAADPTSAPIFEDRADLF